MSWVRQNYCDSSSQYIGLSWSKSLPHQVNLSSSITEDLGDERNTTVYLNFSMPLNNRKDYLSLQNSHDKDGNAVQASLSRSLDSNKPGWGWNLSAQNGKSSNMHASLQRRTRWSDMALGMNRQTSDNALYGSLSGALGLFSGNLYATRMLGSAFAIVDTANVPNVPVYLEHRPVGHTDKNGRLFLNNLNPYQENRIDIDALGLEEDYRAPYTEEGGIPQTGRGALARFSIYKTRAVLLTVKMANGKSVPFSAQVNVENKRGEAPARGTQQTITGYDGKIYLEDPSAGGSLKVRWGSSSCRVTLPQKFTSTRSLETLNARCQ